MNSFIKTAVVFAVIICASGAALAQQPSLEGTMEARKIIVNKEKNEIAVPAEKVVPRDIVEYTLRYRNTGKASARGVELVGPVPSGTAYIDDSASQGFGVSPLFSIDGGKNYQEAPVTYLAKKDDGTEEQRKATPEMITHIKWRMNEALQASEIVNTSYRVRVK